MKPDKIDSPAFTEAYRRMQERLNTPIPQPEPSAPAAPGTLRHAFDTIFTPARLAGLSPSTAYQYRLNLNRFDEFLGRPATLTDLDDETVGKLLAWLKIAKRRKGDGKGISPASRTKVRDNLLCLWKYLHHRRVVDTYPSVPDIVVPVRIPTAWTRPELNRLWEYLSRVPGDVAGVPANVWFMALLSVFWDSAERKTPILGMTWKDVDLNGGWFLARAESRKGGMADKLHKLHPETIKLLRQMIVPKREKVFAWPWCEVSLYKAWREMLTRAGLPTGRERMFHCLRKSVASHVKAAGGSAQEALGHYDARMTQQVYVDPRIAPNEHAQDKLFRLWEPPKQEPEEGQRDAV